MTAPKRLVIFAEGEGGLPSTKRLVRKLMDRCQGSESLFIDDHLIQLGGLTELVKHGGETEWVKKVKAVAKRPNLGAMLLVLDGDYGGRALQTSEGKLAFCAKTYAALLAKRAQECGAGSRFSLAVVIARAEFESWLIAGCPELFAYCQAHETADFLEDQMKGAKGWIARHTGRSYKETRHQPEWTGKIDLDAALLCQMRSFQRMRHAVEEVVQAAREGKVICTPRVSSLL